MNKSWPAWFLLSLLALSVSAGSQSTPESPAQSSSAAKSVTRQPTARSAPDFEDQAWRVLWLGLHDPRAAKRAEAVKALSLVRGSPQAGAFALRALNDRNGLVRTAAAATLGQLHVTKAIPVLRTALSDKEVSVMLAAAHALYVLKDPAAFEIYYSILMGDQKSSEGVIQSQLDRLKDPKQVAEMGFQEGLGFVPFGGMGYEAYRALMNHDSSPVRAEAALLLALDPDSITEDALIQTALADKNLIVREASLDALAQRGDPKCIERLSKNLEDSKDQVRYRTAATIIRLSRINRARSQRRK